MVFGKLYPLKILLIIIKIINDYKFSELGMKLSLITSGLRQYYHMYGKHFNIDIEEFMHLWKDYVNEPFEIRFKKYLEYKRLNSWK